MSRRRPPRSVMSRRSFLARTSTSLAAAAAFPSLSTTRLRGAGAPSDRVSIGCIGVGNHGVRRNLTRLLAEPDARVAAVCDVFTDRRERARAMVRARYGESADCPAVGDFRRILDRGDIDAVMISTPDHWHVLMSVLAIRAGKDVICEKPTLTIREGRILSDTVRRHRAVFQTSTEDRSLPCYHRMAQIVRNGVIGSVRSVEVRLPAGQRFAAKPAVPVPEGLDWNLWLGPAPWVEYTPQRVEPQAWRHVWDYSGGKFSDWGMHQLDTVQWALDTERTGPVEVEGRGTVNEGSPYNTFIDYEVTYRYASGVRVHVKSGGTSLRFLGTKGHVGNPAFNRPVEASAPEIAAWQPGSGDVRLRTEPAGEHRDFLDCVKSRRDPYFPAEVGHRCATLLHMGNISMRLGRKLAWNPEKEEFPGDREANGMRSRPMRAPWTL